MGRIDEMWMTCRASLTAAVLDVRRMGMRCGRAPQIAILSMRLSLTHITIFRQSFALVLLLLLPLPLLLLLPLLLPCSCSQTIAANRPFTFPWPPGLLPTGTKARRKAATSCRGTDSPLPRTWCSLSVLPSGHRGHGPKRAPQQARDPGWEKSRAYRALARRCQSRCGGVSLRIAAKAPMIL